MASRSCSWPSRGRGGWGKCGNQCRPQLLTTVATTCTAPASLMQLCYMGHILHVQFWGPYYLQLLTQHAGTLLRMI